MLEAQLLQESKVDSTNTGGPAFPGPYVNDKGGLEALWKQGGMTLRDYFAAKAIQGILASFTSTMPEIDATAKAAYKYADAMLKARENK